MADFSIIAQDPKVRQIVQEGLLERAQRDHVPYDLWVRRGYLRTTPGKTVSYEFVAVELYELCRRYRVEKIGFDRWNFKHLKPWLAQAGFSEPSLEEQWVWNSGKGSSL